MLGADGPIGNGAVGLDGSSGYVFIPHQDQLLVDSGSFEVWFVADDVSGFHNLFAKNSAGQGTGGQIAMAVRNGEMLAAIGDETTNNSVIGGSVTAGEATQAVLTFGADGMLLYVNGELVNTDDYTGGLQGNFEPLVIGAESGFSTPGTVDDLQRFFDGAIDEFTVYDRALTAADIQQLFELGQGGVSLTGTSEDDTLIGGLDDEVLRGLAGSDDLRGAGGADILLGGAGDDGLSGAAGEDLLRGQAGADRLRGGGDADQLFGNKGEDQLRGGGGDDLLNGGNDSDVLKGGAGGDLFQIDRTAHGVDRILDFDASEGDVLDLSAVVDFQDGDAFADFVQFTEAGGDTSVEVNPDGAGAAFTPVFNLANTTGLDLGSLVASGNVLLSAPES